jgi:hypothetical protein
VLVTVILLLAAAFLLGVLAGGSWADAVASRDARAYLTRRAGGARHP